MLYHSFQKFLPSYLPCKSIRMKIPKTLTFPVVFMGVKFCIEHRLRKFDNWMVSIFDKRGEVTEG
jgi:hypothetical protein